MSLAQIFLDSSKVDLAHKNKDGKTVYEAYSVDALAQATLAESTDKCTGSSLDEAAAMIER